MELTKTDMRTIICTGMCEQSPIAEEYIKEVNERCGIDIVSCYLTTRQKLDCSKRFALPKKINPKKAFLVDLFQLTVYLRGKSRDVEILREKYSDVLIDTLTNILSSKGVTIEYNRSFTPDEIKYYGWSNKKREEWYMEKVIYPTAPAVEQKNVRVESFDDIVLWNYMCDGQRAINALSGVHDLSAKIYYGWDEKIFRPNLYIILPESQPLKVDKSKKEYLNMQILKYLHSVDKNGVVFDEDFKPVYTHWSALSEKLRFSLSRNSVCW